MTNLKEQIESIKNNLTEALASATTEIALEAVRVAFLGRNGHLTEIMAQLKGLSLEEKKEFVFWGNHFFSHENFLENILMYGKSSWHFPGAILSDEIESMYKAKGFWDIKVSVKEEPGKAYCVIHEGKRAVIQQVEVKDNFHIQAKQIDAECFAREFGPVMVEYYLENNDVH